MKLISSAYEIDTGEKAMKLIGRRAKKLIGGWPMKFIGWPMKLMGGL